MHFLGNDDSDRFHSIRLLTGAAKRRRRCAGRKRDARLTTSLAAFIVNRKARQATQAGRFARPQSSQQIGALLYDADRAGEQQRSAKYSGKIRATAPATAGSAAAGRRHVRPASARS